MNTILLVEDDTMIASGITYALQMEGYEVCHATTVTEAGSDIAKQKFDLAILDMQLPDGIGSDLSEQLKSAHTSVIFLTVVDDENTIVKAFDEGAEDYIVKPFRIRELLARVRRVFSVRNGQAEKSNTIVIGQARINTDEAKVYVDDKMIDLTALEYRLLLIFAKNQGVRIRTGCPFQVYGRYFPSAQNTDHIHADHGRSAGRGRTGKTGRVYP